LDFLVSASFIFQTLKLAYQRDGIQYEARIPCSKHKAQSKKPCLNIASHQTTTGQKHIYGSHHSNANTEKKKKRQAKHIGA
jgi:hypothetical protein